MTRSRSEHRAADISYLSGFMHGLREDEARLSEIQTVYDNLTLLGQLLCAGTDITPMRTDFKDLADILLTQLAQELRKKAVLGLHSNARVAIDILIRNLFERTADIGFLATDSSIRAYAQRAATAGDETPDDAEQRSALHERFGEYLRKYSVYHNIILLAPDGKVLLQFDESNPIDTSRDPLIGESLSTKQAYVETFRRTDLLPGEDSPLIYSFRVMSEDHSHPVGVLCLCFRFQDECQRIFRSLLGDEDWTVITLLAPDGKIIASSDPYQFPLGARLERTAGDECRITRFAGREYLTTSCETHGYQGYQGPGWIGQALAPLNHAFEMSLADELRKFPRPSSPACCKRRRCSRPNCATFRCAPPASSANSIVPCGTATSGCRATSRRRTAHSPRSCSGKSAARACARAAFSANRRPTFTKPSCRRYSPTVWRRPRWPWTSWTAIFTNAPTTAAGGR